MQTLKDSKNNPIYVVKLIFIYVYNAQVHKEKTI